MTKKQKMVVGFGAAQAAGALIALIGIVGETVVKLKKS